MSTTRFDITDNRRLMAYTAAAMYGAAALDGLIESILPGDPGFSMLPVFIVLGMFVAVVIFGPRLPRLALGLLGPIGVALNAYALATTTGPTDGAVLYALPVLWQSLFFGRRGAATILACVAGADALALIHLGQGFGYPERWVDVMVSVTAIAIVVRVLQERSERLVARSSAEARIDPLTGLLNRRGFDEQAAVELERLRRSGGGCALVTFDIDYFKRVNDEWGHDVGDRVLCHIGALLTEQARATDVLARFGGEEFVVLLPGAGAADAERFGDRVRAALREQPSDGLPPVRISAGVSLSGPQTELTTLHHQADIALYEAKGAGRDRIRIHRGSSRTEATVGR